MQVIWNLINSALSEKGIGLKPKIEQLLKANINSTTVQVWLMLQGVRHSSGAVTVKYDQ